MSQKTAEICEDCVREKYKAYSYVIFDENGYVNADDEDAVMGNAGNGMSKSDGWDLSEEKSGVVRTVKRGQQALFFRDVYAENFYAKTTILPGEAINDSNPQVGLAAVNDFIAYRAMFINVNRYKNADSRKLVKAMTPYPSEYGWNESDTFFTGDYPAAEKADGIQCEIVKYGEHIFYFLEGELIYDEFLGYLGGKCCPALYALGVSAVFYDYEARALTDVEADAYLNNEKHVYRVTVAQSSGGTVIPAKTAITAGESLAVTIAPEQGYYLTDIKNGEQSIYELARSGIDEGGTFVIPAENIDSNVELDPFYKYVAPRAADRKAVKLSVRSDIPEKDGYIAGADITVKDKHDSTLFYSFKSTDTALSLGMLPLKDTELVPAENGREAVRASGEYVIVVSMQGYIAKGTEVTLDDSAARTIDVDIKLDAHPIGGVAKTGETLYRSIIPDDSFGEGAGWLFDDLTDDGQVKPLEDIKVTALVGRDAEVYFSGKSGKHAIIEFDVENLNNRDEGYLEAAPGVGIIIANRNVRLQVLLFNDLVRVMPDKIWLNNGTQEFRNSAGYNMSVYGAKVRVRVVHDGARLSLYADTSPDDGTDDYAEIYNGIHEDIDIVSAYALSLTSTAKNKVVYSNFRFVGEDDPTVAEQIFGLSHGKITIGGYDTGKIDLVVTGLDGNGYATKGETINFALGASDNPVAISLGGKHYVLTAGDSIDYTVTGDETVSVTEMTDVRAVNGTVSVNSDYTSGLDIDLALTSIEFESGGKTYVYAHKVTADGNFSIVLPVGVHDLEFVHPYLLGVSRSVTVGDTDLGAVTAEFRYARPVNGVAFASGGKAEGSAKAWEEGESSVTTAVASRENKFFHGSGTAYTIEVALSAINDAAGSKGGPMAGIEICDGNESWLFMILDTGSAHEVYFIRKSDWKARRVSANFAYEDGKILLKVVCDGETITLIAGGNEVARFAADDAVFDGDDFVGSEVALGFIANKVDAEFFDFKVAFSD